MLLPLLSLQEEARYLLVTDAEGKLVAYTHFRCLRVGRLHARTRQPVARHRCDDALRM
jgi:hypothetical protein